jgi:uncharacterized protein YsxB (DUF464 family)
VACSSVSFIFIMVLSVVEIKCKFRQGVSGEKSESVKQYFLKFTVKMLAS